MSLQLYKLRFSNSKTQKIGLLIAVLVLVSCNKKLDLNAAHLVNENNNWETISDTRGALLGSYALLRATLAEENGMWLYGELRNGDFAATTRLDLKAIINNNLNAPYPSVQTLSNWRRFYAVINSTSLFIERAGEVLKKDRQYTERNYKVDIAQMRALRAFTYFLMCRIWGDVPLITSSHDGFFDKKARTAQSVVLRYAESELVAAAADLPYRYGFRNDADLPGAYYGRYSDGTVSADGNYWEGILMTRTSVYAILAHIAAWDQRYLEASTYAEIAIRNQPKTGGAFATTASLTASSGFFYLNKAEHLVAFPFRWDTKEFSQVGHIEDLTLAAPIITRARPHIYIPDETINKIFNEPLDQRFYINPLDGKAVTGYFVGYGTSNTVFSKMKCIRNAPQTDGSLALYTSAMVFTRMEELTLLYAESLAVLGNYAAAIDELDRIRFLRGLNGYTGTNDGVIDAIFKERQRELMGEGWRWFDQVRYNRIKRDNTTFNQLIDKGGIYWPIAEDVLRNNALLVQNEYWR